MFHLGLRMNGMRNILRNIGFFQKKRKNIGFFVWAAGGFWKSWHALGKLILYSNNQGIRFPGYPTKIPIEAGAKTLKP